MARRSRSPRQNIIFYSRYEEGLSLAKQIRAAAYLECSALNKIGVREVFEAASKAAIDYKEKFNNNDLFQ